MTLVEPEDVSQALRAGLQRGAEFVEIYAERRSQLTLGIQDKRLYLASQGEISGIGVRVVKDGTVGYAHTSRFDRESLLACVDAACVLSWEGRGEAVGLGEPATVGRISGHPAEPREVRAFLESLDQKARETSGSVSQVHASAHERRREFLVANSRGVFVEALEERARLSVEATAIGDSGLQRGYETLALRMPLEELLKEENLWIAQRAAEMAVLKLSAVPAPAGRLPVVLAKGSGGILFHEACGHGLEADHVIKGASAFKGKLGKKVASSLVTLVDDGTQDLQWGGLAVDDEGNPPSRSVLIKEGVLTSYMYDSLRAPSFKSTPSNGRRQSYKHPPMVRMTNTYVVPGDSDPEDIIADTKRGIYVTRLGGGQVNTTTGDFVFGTLEAFLIEDGRLTAPLRECNLIGNGPEVLLNVDAVASDFDMSPGTCGKDGQQVPVGCGQPTLRVAFMTVGGTAFG